MPVPFEQAYTPTSTSLMTSSSGEEMSQALGFFHQRQPTDLISTNPPDYTRLEGAIMAAPGLALGSFINSVTASVGLTDEDSFKNLLQKNLPRAYDYYIRNQGAVDLIGQGGGVLIPGTLGVKAVRLTGEFGATMRAIPFLGRMFVDTQRMARVERLMGLEAERLAASGVGANFESLPGTVSVYAQLAKERRMLGYVKGLKESAAAEVAVGATMHSSDVIFPKEFEWYDYLPFVGAGALLSVGIEAVVARKAISEATHRTAFLHSAALDPSLFLVGHIDDFTVRTGGEDVAITLRQSNSAELETIAREDALAQTNPLYHENINQAQLENEAYIFGRTQPSRAGQITSQAQQRGYVDKIASRAVPEVAPAFQITREQKANLKEALRDDPTAILGFKEFRDFSPDTQLGTTLQKNVNEYIQSLERAAVLGTKRIQGGKVGHGEIIQLQKKVADAQERARIWKTEMQPFVLRNGEWMPVSNNIVLFTDFADARSIIKADTELELKGLAVNNHVDPTTKNKFSARVDYQFNTSISMKELLDKSLYERSTWYSLYDKMIDNLARVRKEHKNFSIPVTKSDHWIRQEAIDEALRRGSIQEDALLFQKGYSLEQMRHDVLEGKFQDFLTILKRNEKLNAAPESLRKAALVSDDAIRYMLNLPREQFGQLSPLEELFHALRMQGEDNLNALTYGQIVDQALKMKHFPSGYEFLAKDAQQLKKNSYQTLMRGGSFTNLKAPNGNYLRPLIGWRVNMTPQKFTRQAIDQTMLERRNEVLGILTQQYIDPGTARTIAPQASFVSRLATKILPSEIYKRASAVDLLNQSSLRGSGRLTYGRFAARDDAVLQAANDINTIIDKEVLNEIDALYNMPSKSGQTHIQTWDKLKAKANESSLFMFGEFARARQAGWYINKAPIKNAQGKYQFVLDEESDFNAKRFRQLFGRDIQKGDLLPAVTNDRSYKPLEVDELSFNAAQSFNEAGTTLLPEQNKLRQAMGLAPIREKNWWMPPRVFTDKHIAYLVSQEEGGTIKRIITGNTEKELADKKGSQEVQEYLRTNNAVIYSQKEMVDALGRPAFLQARDRAFFNLLDAGDPLVKGTKASRGSSVDPFATSGRELLDESIRSINRQMQNIGRDSIGLMFEPQITYAGRMSQIDAVEGNAKNVWQYYKDQILGERSLKSDSVIGPIYRHLESGADTALEYYWDATKGRGILGAVTNTVRTKLGLEGKHFTELKAKLGDWLPYNTAEEFATSRYNIKPPVRSREVAAKLNQITSLLTLRLMEIAHPLLNFSGVIATMPAVIQALKQRPAENFTEWQSRVSHYGSFIDVNKKPTPFLNTARLMVSGAYRGMTQAGRADWDYAARNGLLRQEVAEIQKTLSSPLKGEGYVSHFVSTWSDKLSILSDKSEEFSRGWAHMAGLLLADQHGLQGDLIRHTFAHRFANEIIGDYRAINRPTVFQGTVGMPLGLFQTYMWNYYQRLFSYIENRDFRAATTQLAMQASVFGGVTIPGFSYFSDLWSNGLFGQSHPVDEIQTRFGPEMADLLLYGTISNIPKIFGGDGIALYSRGDITPRIPTFINPKNVPIANFAINTMTALGKAFDMVRPGGVYSNQQMMELVGTYSQSRPLGRLFELASGYAVDRRGNVISNDVRSWSSVAARVIGMRPLNEAKQIEVLQRQKTIELSQYAMRTRLRDGIKSAVRGGSVNGEMLAQAFEDYAVSGGNSKYFPQFVKAAYMNAVTPKAQLKLEQLLKNNARIQDAIRLMNAGVSFDPQVDTSEVTTQTQPEEGNVP